MIQLQFYYRERCHLCEEMWQELQGHPSRGDFAVETIEISGNPDLESEYGDKIPVLAHGQRHICQYFLDQDVLDAFIRGAASVNKQT